MHRIMIMEHQSPTLRHILAELERIDLLVRLQVRRARQLQRPDEEFRGLVISEHEVDAILGRPVGLPVWADAPDSLLPAEVDALRERVDIDTRRCNAETAEQGGVLRLDELARLFELSRFEVDTVLICLAPEIDLRYERLYAYLQDDVTRKRPSVDLVLNLLCSSFEAKLTARQRFSSNASLIKHHLLYLLDDHAQPGAALLSRYLKLDERVVSYLFGVDECDARLLPYIEHVVPRTPLTDVLLPADVKHGLTLLVQMDFPGNGLLFYFHGPYGVGKQTTAEALCAEKGVGLLIVHGEHLMNVNESDFQTMVQLILREAALKRSAVYWDGFHTLLAEDKKLWLDSLLREVQRKHGLLFLAGSAAWEPADTLHDRPFVRVEFARPDYDDRVRLWETALNGDVPRGSDWDSGEIANAFRFSGGQIRDAAATACNMARRRDPEGTRIGMGDIYAACRLQSSRKMTTLAREVAPHYRWADIVLPPDPFDQLHEICNHARYRHAVYTEWGFDRKLSSGKGLNALFSGPPGTGKTMAAEVIAAELQLELYKIDLSQIVSKYIGETEKNLDRVFTAAQDSNAILLFDEADTLFGRRSEVKDAHDRYANIEVGYLLQKMEEYDGIAFLATNFRQNMDGAFVRRMHFIVEFPFPDEEYRKRIWEVTFPREAPVADDIDFDMLAREVRLTGGNIKNIVLAAAFHAAGDGRLITMAHLLKAVRREHQKLGQTWSVGP